MGVGFGTGEERAVNAAKAAVSSPLLDISIAGARGVLFNVSGGSDLTMWEINEAARVITESIDPQAKVIFGAVQDESLKKGEIKITVIATGFNTAGSVSQPIPVREERPAERKTQVFSFERPQSSSSSASSGSPASPPEDEWDKIPAFLRRRDRL